MAVKKVLAKAQNGRTSRTVKSRDTLGNKTKVTTGNSGNKTKTVTKVNKVYATNAKPLSENPIVKNKGQKRIVTKKTYASNAKPLSGNPVIKSKTNKRK